VTLVSREAGKKWAEIDSINEIDAIDSMTDNEGLVTGGRG